ncbi:MAG: hypothetical protein Q8Q54_14940 [Methylococcales bacterium]|nr:hypothetical protein [Methylococcales bacterium]MDP3840213.1 hypothetical protein [Methylococcales bacterium]
MPFEIISELAQVETFAVGTAIRELDRLQRIYGKGRWRKCKGIATIKLEDGAICLAELHWYEAKGIGKKEFKIKQFIG